MMNMEKHFQSKDGKRWLDVGFESRSIVGSGEEKPSDVVPIQEGARLLFAKGVDNWWKIVLVGLTARKIVRAPFRKRKKS